MQAVSSRNMYSEHGLDARMSPDALQVCQSFMVVLKCRPGSARGPGGVADLFPEIAGLERLGHLLVGAADQVPVAVGLHRAQKVVLQRDRVVGVLAGDREVGFRIPVGVVDREIDLLVALLGELDDALDHAVGDHGAAGEFDFAAQRRVLLGIEAVVAASLRS